MVLNPTSLLCFGYNYIFCKIYFSYQNTCCRCICKQSIVLFFYNGLQGIMGTVSSREIVISSVQTICTHHLIMCKCIIIRSKTICFKCNRHIFCLSRFQISVIFFSCFSVTDELNCRFLYSIHSVCFCVRYLYVKLYHMLCCLISSVFHFHCHC